MAELEKFTDDGVMMLLKHSERLLKNDSNKDILEQKKDLNYSIPMETNELAPREYYKKLKDNSYLYGRGSKREAEAVTCCSWVVTLPKSISDYSTIGKNEVKVLDPDAEKSFFEGANQFVSDRYGTVFYNRIHYDEGGQPHIHIYFVPITKLDHDQIRFKTTKTHEAIKTDTGRYEYKYRFKLENGEKIPLKNYAKMSDYYDSKISAADVLNKAELQHFHKDLANYLKKNNLPGADSVYTGKTDGKNVSVKSLKEFTKATGIKIDELKEHPLAKEELSRLLDTTELKPSERRTIEAINSEAMIEKLQSQIRVYEVEKSHDISLDKDEKIRVLSNTIDSKNQELSKVTDYTTVLEKKLAEMEKILAEKQAELDQSNDKIKELEQDRTNKQQTEKEQRWGHSSTWGEKSQSGWGTKTVSFEEEKTW